MRLLPSTLDPLLQVWFLRADGRRLAVSRVHLRVVREHEELRSDALDDLVKAALRTVRVARAARKQCISSDEDVTGQERHPARCVPGRVHRLEIHVPDTDGLVVA